MGVVESATIGGGGGVLGERVHSKLKNQEVDSWGGSALPEWGRGWSFKS